MTSIPRRGRPGVNSRRSSAVATRLWPGLLPGTIRAGVARVESTSAAAAEPSPGGAGAAARLASGAARGHGDALFAGREQVAVDLGEAGQVVDVLVEVGDADHAGRPHLPRQVLDVAGV